jgi:hypothetical protein
MTIAQLIEMAQKRLTYLSQLQSSAQSLGDVNAEARCAEEIAQTEVTLAALLTLPN